jgi:hypothetical protein
LRLRLRLRRNERKEEVPAPVKFSSLMAKMRIPKIYQYQLKKISIYVIDNCL